MATPSVVQESATTGSQSNLTPALPLATTPTYGYRVAATFPHDPGAFTEGLELHDGLLYEGTGLNGQSSLRRVDQQTGNVVQAHELDPEYFGEGITVFGDQLYQLTWRSHIGFVYDRQTFTMLRTFAYPTEGWGMTHDSTHLIMSDGTSTLFVRDPTTLAEVGRIEVHDDQGPVQQLNELEYIEGEIYANIWKTDTIVRIDPSSGRVTGRIDLTGLLGPEDRAAYQVDVLNGIAYDPATRHILVTGKYWPKLFEIELVATD